MNHKLKRNRICKWICDEYVVLQNVSEIEIWGSIYDMYVAYMKKIGDEYLREEYEEIVEKIFK